MTSRMSDPDRFATGWRPATMLSRLSPTLRNEMLGLGVERAYATGAVLMLQGSSRREALLLLHGYVKIIAGVEGQSVLLTVRGQGDVIGDLAAMSGHVRSATVLACTPIVARFILPETLRAFLAKHPVAAELLNSLMVSQLIGANQRRVDFATLSVRERLARVLSELIVVCGEVQPDASVRLPRWFGQADLADLVGASVDSVQRALRDLRGMGLVDTGYRSVTVLDPARLTAVRAPQSGSR